MAGVSEGGGGVGWRGKEDRGGCWDGSKEGSCLTRSSASAFLALCTPACGMHKSCHSGSPPPPRCALIQGQNSVGEEQGCFESVSSGWGWHRVPVTQCNQKCRKTMGL